MRRAGLTTSALLFAAAMITGCSSTTSPPDAGMPMDSGMPMMKTATPSAATSALLTQIQGYEAWPTFAENPAPKASMSHMGMFVEAHINPVVSQAVTSNTLPIPNGAIIVKDNFAHASDSMPMTITTMAKQDGGWYWAETTPGGMVVVDSNSGQSLEGTGVPMCLSCHSGKSTNDDVFTHPF